MTNWVWVVRSLGGWHIRTPTGEYIRQFEMMVDVKAWRQTESLAEKRISDRSSEEALLEYIQQTGRVYIDPNDDW